MSSILKTLLIIITFLSGIISHSAEPDQLDKNYGVDQQESDTKCYSLDADMSKYPRDVIIDRLYRGFLTDHQLSQLNSNKLFRQKSFDNRSPRELYATYRLWPNENVSNAFVKVIQKRASKGEAEVQHILAELLFYGRGLKKDVAASIYWFTTAANNGSFRAQLHLGLLYIRGNEVKKDIDAGVELIRKSANQGFVHAISQMGQIYFSGLGVKQDLDTSVKFTKIAAKQGFFIAQFELAGMHSLGHGVDKDFSKTFDLYAKSASQGYSRAIDILPMLGQIGKIMDLVGTSDNQQADQSNTKDQASSSSSAHQDQPQHKLQPETKKVEFTQEQFRLAAEFYMTIKAKVVNREERITEPLRENPGYSRTLAEAIDDAIFMEEDE